MISHNGSTHSQSKRPARHMSNPLNKDDIKEYETRPCVIRTMTDEEKAYCAGITGRKPIYRGGNAK